MNRHRRIAVVHLALAALAVAVVAKAAHVQLVQGRAWSKVARRQHYSAAAIPAPRGSIFDAGGRTLATTRDVVRLEVAPREIRGGDRRTLRRALIAAGVDESVASRAIDLRRSWVVLPGLFVAEDVASIIAMRGVHTTPISDRTYAASAGLRAILGRVDERGIGADGLELALDSVLRGTDGAAELVRDVRGGRRSFASPTKPGQAPRAGHAVVLTINHELQEIAERTLSSAAARMRADGGDIVILDPRSGEILAMAGVRDGLPSPSATAVTEPFEPGSTLKPLIAAALLARGRARTQDIVPTRGGTYELHGRIVHDEPHEGRPTPSSLSLADVIRYSSNVGIVQFAERLAPREEFEALRDFGLGTPTGLAYSSESGGTLRPPHTWSRQTPASLAMGYELSVTPLQLALAYAAIANGGELLEPAIVKEIRSPDGEVRFRQSRRVVRRVMGEQIARTMRTLLAGVVARGTAVDADLSRYALAGKTGTPRRTVNGRYAPMQYNPNFVGLFPADAPQLVVVVKLSSPKGDFYGGRTAAPMTKTIVEAALAARDAALDRSELATPSLIRGAAVQSGRADLPAASAAARGQRGGEALSTASGFDEPTRSVVLHLPHEPERTRRAAVRGERSVPNVSGLPLRDAVRSLHLAGFRVQLTRAAPSTASASVTDPAPGALVSAGSLVRLRYSR